MSTPLELDPVMFERVHVGRTDESRAATSNACSVPFYGELPAWERAGKRGMDIALSVGGLALFGLVLPLIAVAIRLDSRGPIIYSQVRVGINRRSHEPPRSTRTRSEGLADRQERRDRLMSLEERRQAAEGRPFTIYKLRTMYVDSESDGMRWTDENDRRITRIGHLLRRTRLDEFPQFYNALKGEMSIIGPRPERPPFIEVLRNEVPGYLDRLRFKPGITGLAQIENGYDKSIDGVCRKVRLDRQYMATFSLLHDLAILARTVRVVLTGRGAR